MESTAMVPPLHVLLLVSYCGRRRPRENEEKVPSENHPSPHSRSNGSTKDEAAALDAVFGLCGQHTDKRGCAWLAMQNRRIQRRGQKPVKQAGVGRYQCAVTTSLYLICSAPPGPVPVVAGGGGGGTRARKGGDACVRALGQTGGGTTAEDV
ncbi:hypothetical protein B0H13DRAFT_1905636 [Mycena leptocephala]|nr:hypothetical protein B0H13DRAFT_1905636 [Mycena leptocephala]